MADKNQNININFNTNADNAKKSVDGLAKSVQGLDSAEAGVTKSVASTSKELLNQSGVMSGLDKVTNGLSGQLTGLAEGFKTLKNAGMAFIATPIGAAIAAITTAFAAGKAIFDYNVGLQEANKQLKALGVSASELSNVRSEIQATADQFDKSFKEIATTANSLAKSYGISISEANRIITEGLIKGGAASEEFLESISEYDAIFSKAGFSAQEFINIVNEGSALGVFTDKLPDAIKEADLSLREQTKSTRDTLVNAFGASFSDDILKKVRTGELTTKEALEAISTQAEKTALTQQQQAQLTADIFRGAGEDAGGALVILQAVGSAANKALSESEQAALDLNDAYGDLNKAQADLFEVENFSDVLTNIKIVGVEALTAIIEYIADLKKDIQPLIDLVGVVLSNAWTALKTNVSTVFDVIAGGLKLISNGIKTFVDFFKALITGDFSGAIDALKNGFTNMLNIVSNTFAKLRNSIIDGLKGIVDNVSTILDALGVDVDALQKRLDRLKSPVTGVKVSATATETTVKRTVVADVDPNAKAAQEKADKEAEARRKKELEDAKKQRELLASLNKQANDTILKAQETDLETSQRKLKEKYEADVESARGNLLTLNNLKAAYLVESARLTDESQAKENEKAEKQRTKDAEDAVKAEKTKQDFLKKFKEEQKSIDDAETLEEAEKIAEDNQRLIEEELAKSLAEAERLNASEAEKQAIRDYYGEQTIENENKFADASIEIEKRKSDAQVKALQVGSNVLGQAADALGKSTAAGKAAAVAQATIDTYTSAVSAYKSLSGIPIVGPALGAVAAGLAVATGIANVKKILAVKTPGGGGSGGSVPTEAATAASAAPNVSFVGSSDNQIASSISSVQQQQEPVRAYVVSSDVTTAQSLDRNIIEATSLS